MIGGKVFLLAAATSAFTTPSAACDIALHGGAQVESPRYVLVYRATAPKVETGKHFSLDIAVCPKPGTPPASALEVDAVMPEHGHGMNYRALVKRVGDGRFRADGLLFHMTGRWEFRFAVRGGATPDRLTHAIVID